MKNKNIIILLFVVTVLAFTASPLFAQVQSQDGKACLEELLEIEEKNSIKNYKGGSDVFHLNYSVSTTDWDNHTVNSNVKVYKSSSNMHFFSEQGIIYQDEEELYMVLPMQKVVMISSTNKEAFNTQIGDDFYAFRKKFLDSCEVVSCNVQDKNTDIKTLSLKVSNKPKEAIHIIKMVYRYNTKTQKIISVTTYYDKKYKVKKVVMRFNKVSLTANYKFNKSKKYVFGNKGVLLSKYANYEVVDNRDNDN